MTVIDSDGWAANTQNPITNAAGDLIVWDPESGGFRVIDKWSLDSLMIGEVQDQNIPIRQSLTFLNMKLTANGTSEIKGEVYDPEFKLYNANAFVLDRRMQYNGQEYMISRVTIHHAPKGNFIAFSGRPIGVQKMKNDKGAANFGAISPTAFAQQKASEFGMTFFGEPSAASDAITRVSNDTTDESTWDVLMRLAKDLKYSVFEANNQLFFASDAYTIANQPNQGVSVPGKDFDNLKVLQADITRDSDADFPSQLDLKFQKDKFSTSLFPGVGIRVAGLSVFNTHIYMIDNVQWDFNDDSSPVSITARTVEGSEDQFCGNQVLTAGATGFCVARAQIALGVDPTALYGPYTEQKVKDFQAANGLPVTGIVDAATWEKIGQL